MCFSTRIFPFNFFPIGKTVASEVRRVMTPNLTYSSPTCSLINFGGSTAIPRNPKHKSKVTLAMEKYEGKKKGRVSTQKKLVVFDYMGRDPPKVFTRTDKRICMRGLLPPISIEASGSEVRREICDVIRTCSFPDLTECTLYDFEFIDMSGKQASIPRSKVGFEWKGRAVKELPGSGCVYVRLTRDVGFDTDTSSDEFPIVVLGNSPVSNPAPSDPQMPCSSRSLAPTQTSPSYPSTSQHQPSRER